MAVRAAGMLLRRGVGGVASRSITPMCTPMLAACQRQPQPPQLPQPHRHYAMRLELTEHGILWRRPEYVPSWKPEKSGDMKSLEHPPETRTKIKLLAAKDALDKVDDTTKQLLSLKFGTVNEQVRANRYDLMRQIQRHQYDTGSLEVTIAMLTVRIRRAQRELITNPRGLKHTIRKRVVLNETIARRKKLLKHLRRMDYKRFEWLIAELGILYRPPIRYTRWVTRKISLRKLVSFYGQKIRRERLGAYQTTLDEEKELFEKEKAETLKWIAETETRLGVPLSVEAEGDGSASAAAASSS